MNNQISMFVEEVQEDEEQNQNQIPVLDTDDLDSEWLKNSDDNPFRVKNSARRFDKLTVLPTIGFGNSPFSPPELIVFC